MRRPIRVSTKEQQDILDTIKKVADLEKLMVK